MSIITFMSSDRRTGCSMIARCFAERLAEEYPQKRVMLLCCSAGDVSCGPQKDAGLSFSDIASFIQKDLADFDEICEKSRETANLSCIRAFRQMEPGNISPQAMASFVRELSQRFSLVVCDAGCSLSFGASLGALFAADRVYEVVYPGEACLRRHEWMSGLLEKLEILPFGYVLNPVSRDNYYTTQEVRERLGAWPDRFYTVRRSVFAESAEAEGRSLLCYRDRAFVRDVSRLVSGICFDI